MRYTGHYDKNGTPIRSGMRLRAQLHIGFNDPIFIEDTIVWRRERWRFEWRDHYVLPIPEDEKLEVIHARKKTKS